MGPRIAVVIPYYQCERGLLHCALESIAAQKFPPAQVIVIDDGSPCPAKFDLESGNFWPRLSGLTLVPQKNRGVSAARNAGLDRLYQDIDAVAFLDSDDTWDSDHLENAAKALACGADFYFSNYRHEGKSADAFREEPKCSHLCSDQPGVVRWLQGAPELMQLARWLKTSSVVFRRSIHPTIRFPLKLRYAGEDQIVFWELTLRARSIMYCSRPTITYGSSGFGLYRNAHVWGTRVHLKRLVDEIHLFRIVLKRYSVLADKRKALETFIAARRSEALSSAAHLIMRRQLAAAREILRLLWVDPGCFPQWSVEFPKLIRSRPSSRDSTRHTHKA